METLHMKIGQNLGNVLLDIAQNAVQNGDINKALSTYTKSLHGFTDEYALMLLKNEAVLMTSEDEQTMTLSTDKEDIESNKNNIIDWSGCVQRQVDDLIAAANNIAAISESFTDKVHGDINDFSITDVVTEHFGEQLAKRVGMHNIAAKLIAGAGFSGQFSDGEDVWEELCSNVEGREAETYQYALYYIVKYVQSIREMHKSYMKLVKCSQFLFENGLATKPAFFEMHIERMLDIMHSFSDVKLGYHHPLCDTKLSAYKHKLYNDLKSTAYGSEYFTAQRHIIAKDILDGYDAGWLSPDGKYYGMNGETSELMHLVMSEKLVDGWLDSDLKLEKAGWVKLHHDEVYGYFGGAKDGSSEYKYCPTAKQVEEICKYADKFYNGKILTSPAIVKFTEPVSTYKLKQMDEVMLHNTFEH